MRLGNLERSHSVPNDCAEPDASQMILNRMSKDGPSRKGVVESQKGEKPPLVNRIENFLDDYFRQGKGQEVLPFVLDANVFGREVNVDMGKSGSKKRMLVGEFLFSGLLDRVAINGQCWVGNDLRYFVDLLTIEEPTKVVPVEEGVRVDSTGPKHPPPVVISSSSSEASEGTSAQFPLLRSNVTSLPNSPQIPEPAYTSSTHISAFSRIKRKQ